MKGTKKILKMVPTFLFTTIWFQIFYSLEVIPWYLSSLANCGFLKWIWEWVGGIVIESLLFFTLCTNSPIFYCFFHRFFAFFTDQTFLVEFFFESKISWSLMLALVRLEVSWRSRCMLRRALIFLVTCTFAIIKLFEKCFNCFSRWPKIMTVNIFLIEQWRIFCDFLCFCEQFL